MAGPNGHHGPRGFLTEEEKQNRPKITKELLVRILSYLKPYWARILLVFAAILLSAVVGLLPSMITGRIVDEALVGRSMKLLIRLLILAFCTLALSQIIGVAESYINAWISQRIIFDMKNQMYAHLQTMPQAFFTNEKPGDIVTRMTSDINGVSSVLSGTLTSIASNIVTVVTTLVALFSMNWRLALMGVIVVPLFILPTKEVGRTRWALLTKGQEKRDVQNQIIDETLSVSGALLVKLFTREKLEYDRFVRVNEEVARISIREARSGKWFRVAMGMFSQLGPLLIYFAGGYLIIARGDTSLTVGTITAVVALVNRLYHPVQSLLNIHVDVTRSMALFTRIFDYLDRKADIVSRPGAQKPDFTRADIVFEDVHFAYTEGREILNGMSFTIPAGQAFALVGPSGSGKSTAVNLIPRLYDVNSGSVKIAGVDVRDIDLAYLRKNVGMVTQESYLFNGTIRENLRVAKADATDAEIEAACRAANIHDFIAAQPGGYDTEVGNRGLKLSGGEKQRLSIARVLLKDPRILILDEATSALDSISESAVQDALERALEGRTSLVIAHRLSTVLASDRILVLADGRVAEQGEHAELLAQDGIYTQLYETQFKKVMELEEQAKA